jgi:hypothetical protein
MALILLNPGAPQLGQFDALDAQLTSFKGGEIATWGSVSTVAGVDLAAADVINDGYMPVGGTPVRPVVKLCPDGYTKPTFLTDDGTVGYGTLFGTVVGGTVGQTSYGPLSTVPASAVLGPHTALGSGKITLWDKPGLYGVTLDAVDTTSGGLIPTNSGLTVGSNLSYTSAGLLTPAGSHAVAGLNGTHPIVGRLASFETNGSVVTTPQSLVAALNSPSGSVSSLAVEKFYMAVFWFSGAGSSEYL